MEHKAVVYVEYEEGPKFLTNYAILTVLEKTENKNIKQSKQGQPLKVFQMKKLNKKLETFLDM